MSLMLLLLLLFMASGICNGSPQLDNEIIGEAERFQIGAVDGLREVHRVGFHVRKIPDLWSGMVSFIRQSWLRLKIYVCTWVASSASLMPINESSNMLMASIPTWVASSCYNRVQDEHKYKIFSSEYKCTHLIFNSSIAVRFETQCFFAAAVAGFFARTAFRSAARSNVLEAAFHRLHQTNCERGAGRYVFEHTRYFVVSFADDTDVVQFFDVIADLEKQMSDEMRSLYTTYNSIIPIYKSNNALANAGRVQSL